MHGNIAYSIDLVNSIQPIQTIFIFIRIATFGTMPNNVMSNKYTFKTKTDKYYVYLILICYSKIYMIESIQYTPSDYPDYYNYFILHRTSFRIVIYTKIITVFATYE